MRSDGSSSTRIRCSPRTKARRAFASRGARAAGLRRHRHRLRRRHHHHRRHRRHHHRRLHLRLLRRRRPSTSRPATRSSPAASTRGLARCRGSSPMTEPGSRSSSASGATKVSSFYAFATIAAGQLATLERLQIDYNGNATGNNTNVSLRVWNWSTSAWVTIDGPVRGATADRSATWSTSSPAAYVSPVGRGASERPWHAAVVLPRCARISSASRSTTDRLAAHVRP